MILDEGKHYIYRHIRLDTNQPFYIGIGTKKDKILYESIYLRAFLKHNRNKWWKNIISKTLYKVEILLESDNYQFIKEKEIEFIKLYGRKDLTTGILVNLTDGGDGSLNVKKAPMSTENRKQISLRNKNRKISEETRQKQSTSHLNPPIEIRNNYRNGQLGKKRSIKTIEATRARMLNLEGNASSLIDERSNKTYKSITEYSNTFNIPRSTLLRHLEGKVKINKYPYLKYLVKTTINRKGKIKN